MRWACSLVCWHAWSCTLWICSTRTDCKKYHYIDTLQWLREVWGNSDLKIGIWGFVSWSCQCMGFALSLLEFLPRNKVTVIWKPHYASDLALCNFFVFSEIQAVWQGRIFSVTTVDVRSQVTVAVFQRMHSFSCFKWQHRHWACCMKFQAEGDDLDRKADVTEK